MGVPMHWFTAKIILIVVWGIILAPGCALTPKQESPFDDRNLFEALDKNKDSKISLDEFLPIWKNKDDAEKYFRRLDKDEDGFLTRDEFRTPGIIIFRW